MKKLIFLLSVGVLSLLLILPLMAQEDNNVEVQPAVQQNKGETAQPAESTQPEATKQPGEEQKKQQEAAVSPFSFSMNVGSEIIDGKTYTSIAMNPDLAFGKFGIGLDVILRFDSKFSLYKPDWDSVKDIVTKINYIRWDKKGAPVFIKIGLLDDVYLGHGTIFYRYSNKLFLPGVRRIGIQFDLNFRPFGSELFDDDVIDNRIFGGRIYFRPFVNSKIFFLNSLAIGFTAAADVKLDKTKSPTDKPTDKVTVIGADLDVPIVKVGSIFSFLLFTDYVKNLYFSGSNGTGIIPGFIMNIIGFRFIGEYHIYNPNYDGPYFNAFYDIERNGKLETLKKKTDKTEGWSIKMAKDILNLIAIGFEIGANKGENADMHIEVAMKQKLLNKFKASVYYDKNDIKSFNDAFTAKSPNARLTANVNYSVSENVDMVITYQKNFVTRDDGTVEPVDNYAISTKIVF